MTAENYLKLLTEDIHSACVATIGADGLPATRIIDMMLWDEKGVYFLTAKGKEFHRQLTKQGFIALSAVKGKVSVSLRGKIKNIGSEKLDEIFEKNPYMKGIYPRDTRLALDVFCIFEADGEFFDISIPEHIVRDSFTIGKRNRKVFGYYAEKGCIGCGKCLDVCPQNCISLSQSAAYIDGRRCLHCGRCAEICPKKVIKAEFKNDSE